MSDSESTGGKYDSDDSFFDPAAEYGWLGEYGKLLRACGFMGSAKAARRLLDAGVPIKGPRGEPTPLACAIQHNMVDIARLLVARGADVNKRDRDMTPVFRACGLIDNSILKLLLSSGASPSVRGRRVRAFEPSYIPSGPGVCDSKWASPARGAELGRTGSQAALIL